MSISAATAASAMDVAAYLLKDGDSWTHMKLQKLLYYCQAWSLVWDEKPLFADRIEAWANGPVVPSVFSVLKGKYYVSSADLPGADASHLGLTETETVDAVTEFYANRDPHWLSELTHSEKPWKDARAGLPPGERGSQEITWASMAEYYAGL